MRGIVRRLPMRPGEKIIKYKIESSQEFEVYYLTSLYNSKYRLKKLLKILVEKPKTKEDSFLIVSDEIDRFSYGKTLEEAVREFRILLVEYYKELISFKKMSNHLKKQKKILQQYIVKGG